MNEFEQWFKTTSAYRMLESMNYYKMDLFHWVEARGEYRHTSVQIAFMTWVEQQAKIDQLQKQVGELENQAQSARVLCETACELLDDYAHQDAMVILDDLDQALRGEHE